MNMSYCRFENTMGDLQDCADALGMDGFDGLSESELKYATRLVDLCRDIAELHSEEPK